MTENREKIKRRLKVNSRIDSIMIFIFLGLWVYFQLTLEDFDSLGFLGATFFIIILKSINDAILTLINYLENNPDD